MQKKSNVIECNLLLLFVNKVSKIIWKYSGALRSLNVNNERKVIEEALKGFFQVQ